MSEQRDLIEDRRQTLSKLRDELGVNPYGQRVDGIISLETAQEQYSAEADSAHKADSSEDNRPVVRVAGRIIQQRVMGNLIFMRLRDQSGDLQAAVSKKAVGADTFKIAKLAELSDIVVVEGRLGKTKTQEITVWAQKLEEDGNKGERMTGETPVPLTPVPLTPVPLTPVPPAPPTDAPPPDATLAPVNGFQLASKTLAPPPDKFHGLQDKELRYRKRYIDLYANPKVMQTMQLRIAIIDEIRKFMQSQGFLEVETPMLQPIHGGAAARPFVTHHNALDSALYLRIAPELYLKRLLVGGMNKVFEINRNFRNEGVSPRHNPEFTMLEAYAAFGSWKTMAEMVEEMICTVAQNVIGTLKIEHKDDEGQVIRTVDLSRPWRRVPITELVEEQTGWKFDKQPLTNQQIDDLRQRFPQKDLKLDGTPGEQLVELYEKLIESTLINPTFVTRIPGEIIPLARRCEDDDYFADVYELAINGVEISPGYSELNDPEIQEKHFRHQVGDEAEQQQIDEDFLEALRVGMPPAGGIGLGIDRLVMMLTGAQSIRDVILFPLMRKL